MGKINVHLPVKYFTALTYVPSFDIENLSNEVESLISPVEIQSISYNFSSFTDYYQLEMGNNLRKIFWIFSELLPPDGLPEMKIKTNQLEKRHSIKGKRQINLDPGYISQAKLVLATTKDYSHRLYLSQGIFADLHLQFSQGSFRKQPWTYPDYQQAELILFFNQARNRYLQQLGES
jgi:hypothetical protein